ncbi:DUF4239 domain-containing protein [Streptomyces sp. SID3343]|uniref:bestrophin-like domain n=1 Tax=Streptomyces sp. SID3343 TaxID=2690260 RepID=UPI00136C19DB|nr:DUF4239 domain-containing protein [Streptomyces sp. SID3343]MYW06584.1 DUF4239 domain-containing protein [Streptomyces sp. SID3343]
MSHWAVLALAMAAVCAVVLAIVVLKQRRLPDDDDPSGTPDVLEYMTMMIGVIYAIVLGLAIAAVWEGRGAAEDEVRHESQALHEVSERVRAYPEPVRDRIRADIDAYVVYVVHKEWDYMADHGELSQQGAELFDKIRYSVTDYVPANDQEAQMYQPILDQIAIADDARQGRGGQAGATMPALVWFGLLIGAAVTVGMVFTLQIRRSAPELIVAGLFSALIGFLLFLIWDLDAPFGQGMTAASDAFGNLFPNAK